MRVVGPAALGREIQSGWHKLIDSPKPMGWHNQIPNEPAFLVHVLRAVAAGRGEAPEAVAAATTANARRVFTRLS